jgi:eukaryotic-like serine/threonine-protein kinase
LLKNILNLKIKSIQEILLDFLVDKKSTILNTSTSVQPLMKKYIEIKKIQRGESSNLFQVQDSEGNFFIKKQLKKNADTYQQKRFLNEISILNQIKSDYLIPIIDYSIDSAFPYYIMPQAQMNLENYLQNNSGISEIWIIDQIIQGVQALHDKKILHLDLNPKNVLVFIDNNEKKSVKISDLGLALHIDDVKNMNDTDITIYGTLTYIPPRDMSSIKNADFASDIYNSGKILHYILTGNPFTYSSDFLQEGGMFGKVIQAAVFEDDTPVYRSIKEFNKELEAAKKYEQLFPYFTS